MSEAARHRAAWQARPELRAVYREWFDRLLAAAGPRRPVVETGSGPSFFKAVAPTLVATDVLAGLAVAIHRFFHHEECRLGVDVARPFASGPRASSRATRRFPISSSPASVTPACLYTW